MSDHEHIDDAEARIDSLARSAGAALRQPAPSDGPERIRSSRRRRRLAEAIAGGAAIAALAVVMVVVLVGRNDEGDVVETPPASTPVETAEQTIVESVPSSTPDTSVDSSVESSVDTAPASTSEASTPTPATSSPATSTTAVPTSTTSTPFTPTWTPTAEEFPALSYVACCGTDWEGDPSPPVPTDPTAALPAGIYNVRPLGETVGGVSTEDITDLSSGALTLELRPYVRCADLPAESGCFGEPPFTDTDLGVPDESARTFDLALDDTVEVAISGFRCDPDTELLIADRQLGIGSGLRALAAELDAAYERAIGTPLADGADPAQLATEIAADSPDGFFDPGCPGYAAFAWQPSAGPAILTSFGLPPTPGIPLPEVVSLAGQSIRATALAVDEQGTITLYVNAGFVS